MKNIEASVGAVPTQEKEEKVKVEVEEEEDEYTEHRNEMYFFLEEYPEYRISAVGRWRENSKGKVIEDADIYFRHISSGRLCKSVYACTVGVEYDRYAEEKWDTLYYRIRTMLLRDLRRIVCYEKKYAIHPI